MDFVLDVLTEWIKEMLTGGIMGNLSGLFNSVNQQVAAIIIVTNTWNIVMGGIGYGAKCGYTGAGIISSDRLSSVNRKRRVLQLYGPRANLWACFPA